NLHLVFHLKSSPEAASRRLLPAFHTTVPDRATHARLARAYRVDAACPRSNVRCPMSVFVLTLNFGRWTLGYEYNSSPPLPLIFATHLFLTPAPVDADHRNSRTPVQIARAQLRVPLLHADL